MVAGRGCVLLLGPLLSCQVSLAAHALFMAGTGREWRAGVESLQTEAAGGAGLFQFVCTAAGQVDKIFQQKDLEMNYLRGK